MAAPFNLPVKKPVLVKHRQLQVLHKDVQAPILQMTK